MLDINSGEVDLTSIVDAPFGIAAECDTNQFMPLEIWLEDLEE